ncbi:unnamed protein product [Protopolystoma xenopodis]|uniref:Uncharacterized protein n=1 Tax=Protopolystoma xenopodis TaxID=117903 RepID=A0A3S5BA34_9PLAT|nr:unnamed protein product [Protopolystoma xenopodis]
MQNLSLPSLDSAASGAPDSASLSVGKASVGRQSVSNNGPLRRGGSSGLRLPPLAKPLLTCSSANCSTRSCQTCLSSPLPAAFGSTSSTLKQHILLIRRPTPEAVPVGRIHTGQPPASVGFLHPSGVMATVEPTSDGITTDRHHLSQPSIGSPNSADSRVGRLEAATRGMDTVVGATCREDEFECIPPPPGFETTLAQNGHKSKVKLPHLSSLSMATLLSLSLISAKTPQHRLCAFRDRNTLFPSLFSFFLFPPLRADSLFHCLHGFLAVLPSFMRHILPILSPTARGSQHSHDRW